MPRAATQGSAAGAANLPPLAWYAAQCTVPKPAKAAAKLPTHSAQCTAAPQGNAGADLCGVKHRQETKQAAFSATQARGQHQSLGTTEASWQISHCGNKGQKRGVEYDG